jgi:hypothetical protein
MSLDSIHALAIASGWRPPKTEPRPSEAPTVPPEAGSSRDAPTATPGAHRGPIGIASFSIAPASAGPEWVPLEPPARSAVAPKPASDTPGPIDIASFSIAPWSPTRRPARKRARHEDVYDISRDELAERLHDWRQSRRMPSRFRGDLTNRHRLVMAMEPGRWYTSPAIQELIDLPLKDVTAMLRQMSQWPLLYVEKADLPEAYREPSYLVPAPFGRGGKTRRSPARLMYRLTESGRELKLEGEDFAARGKAT